MNNKEALEIITNAIQKDGMTRDQDLALAVAQYWLTNAEPVIRCKDCIHCRKTEYSYDCELFRDMAIGLDDYCSSAVRDEK